MFLITTADERFWRTDQPVLFLGEWCRLFRDRVKWSGLDHEVLPYHWDDRDKFAADWLYLDAVYEKYLGLLADGLNHIHGTAYSHRYWRILVGLWLRSLIDAVFDRRASIVDAAKTGRVTNTLICSTEKWVPQTLTSFSFDPYNQYLYGRIIKHEGTVRYQELPVRHFASTETAPRGASSRLSRAANEIARQLRKGPGMVLRQGVAVLGAEVYPRMIRRAPAKIVFAGTTYLTFRDQLRLQTRLGQIPFLYHGEKLGMEPSAPDWTKRERLRLPNSTDPFERLLNELVPDQIPMVYVEHYAALQARALEISPVPPPAILTAFSMNYRLCFEFWAAHSSERGASKILISQHGGGFGTSRHSSVETHFVRIADRYYTWGSHLDGERNVKPMPSMRLRSSAKALTSSDPAGPILWVATSTARYKTFADSGVVGPHMLRYIDEQTRFGLGLCKEASELLVWRYFNELWEERDRLMACMPGLKTQRAAKNQLGRKSAFMRVVRRSRLTVHTANETTYLETLAANFPTVAFWNPDLYEIRASLQPDFDMLRDVGILHFTPESAADAVNRIHADPLGWWRSHDVQVARAQFCSRLACTSDDWLAQWTTELGSYSSQRHHNV